MDHGLMAVHAHPDDECIATGGVLLRAHADGIRTCVVTCTGGELGEIVGAGMDPDEVRPRLAEVRRGELTEALRLLHAGTPRFLGYRDSGMLGTEGNDDPRSFWRAPFDEAVGRLVAQIREFRPTVLVTYDAFGGYGHPDHVQSHRVSVVAVAAAAVEMLFGEAGEPWRVPRVYLHTIPRSFVAMANRELAARGLPSPFGQDEAPPIGTPDELITTVVDVSEHLAQKMAALRAHRSQVGEDSFFLNMPDELNLLAFGTESFVRHGSDVAAGDGVETDLFAALR